MAPATLGAFARTWLEDRPLRPRSRHFYAGLLDQKILPTLDDLPLKDITSLTIREWYRTLDPKLPAGGGS